MNQMSIVFSRNCIGHTYIKNPLPLLEITRIHVILLAYTIFLHFIKKYNGNYFIVTQKIFYNFDLHKFSITKTNFILLDTFIQVVL